MSPRIELKGILRDGRYKGVYAIASVECPMCKSEWLLSQAEYSKEIRACPECGHEG